MLFVTNSNHVFIIQNPTTSNGMTSKKKIKDQQSSMCKKYFVEKKPKRAIWLLPIPILFDRIGDQIPRKHDSLNPDTLHQRQETKLFIEKLDLLKTCTYSFIQKRIRSLESKRIKSHDVMKQFPKFYSVQYVM